MVIQLAYEYQGFNPDDVIEVDDHTGRRLIREGKARPAPPVFRTDTQ